MIRKSYLHYSAVIILLVSVVTISLYSCTPNKMYRTDFMSTCEYNQCSNYSLEIHDNSDEKYDLAFVEFSDRGNVFDRNSLNKVLTHIKKSSEAEYKRDNGIMLLVYVHGWKHNATNSTGDVNKFRKALRIISKANRENGISGRKVIGLYVGWRGLSLNIPFVNNLTYWERKNVAHHVGTGGVTELLVRLNKIVYQKEKYNNVFVISGHSLGGALVLSSVKDILISNIVNTNIDTDTINVGKYKSRCDAYYKGEAFSDGIFLLNPAVEANELFQMKELVSEERCYSRNQPKLLHILSSNVDFANNYFFKLGQFFGVSMTHKETKLKRKIYKGDPTLDGKDEKKNVIYSERNLDIMTVGNFPPFRTGLDLKNQKINLCKGNASCVSENHKEKNFPVSPFEPISIIYTDKDFIKNHGDISNHHMLAYMTTAVIDNQFKKNKSISNRMKLCFERKKGSPKFLFSKCLNIFEKLYEKY